jgi:hypothetical protein
VAGGKTSPTPPTRRQWRDRLAGSATPDRLVLLAAHSGLPGPRANLTLLDAAADLADPSLVEALLASGDEYLTACGAAGLGELIAADADADAGREARLRELARDQRWRVREGVAMALQRLGDADLRDGGQRLTAVTDRWSADDDPLVQRAVVAGVCEPRLLRTPAAAAAAVRRCGTATNLLLARPVRERRSPPWRTLRQALGYCWSVAVAADPGAGLPIFGRLADRAGSDPDLAWIVRSNRGKARMAKLLV